MIRSSRLDFAHFRKTLSSTTNTYLTEISDGERSFLCGQKNRDHRSTLGRQLAASSARVRLLALMRSANRH